MALLVNQQGDLHRPALRAARATARGLDAQLGAAAVDLLRVTSFVAILAVAVAAVLALIATDRPPGPLAGGGLLLLLAHGAGRGATFLGLVSEPDGTAILHRSLEVTEVIGLAMIAFAAIRYRPAPAAAPALDRESVTVG